MARKTRKRSCYIGSDEAPVHIHLTTGGAGFGGDIKFNEAFTITTTSQSRLVDVGWKIEEASAPKGCGGAYEAVLDKTLSNVLEIHPWKSGILELKGDLHDGAIPVVEEEGLRKHELP